MAKRHFTSSLFTFLKDLDANNEREWFHEHKDRYLNSVQEPAMEFIIDFKPKLQQISPHFTAEAKTVGGSLFRIQRDTRFSKDKTPYKQNTGMQFRHESGKDAHAPGFYLHIQPGRPWSRAGRKGRQKDLAYQQGTFRQPEHGTTPPDLCRALVKVTGRGPVQGLPRVEPHQFDRCTPHTGVGKQHPAQWPGAKVRQPAQPASQRGGRDHGTCVHPGFAATEQLYLANDRHATRLHA